MRYFSKMLFTAVLMTAFTFSTATIADGIGHSARLEASKSRMQENMGTENVLNNNQLTVHQAYGRTVITGTMYNREDIHADGNVATAAGTQLNVGVERGQNENNVTGDRVDVEGTPGSVYIRVNTVNRGNISAEASGFNAEANAAGSQINIKNARGVVSIHANTVSRGDINANASGLSNVEANAAATQINIENNPSIIRVDGTFVNSGNITATAKGGAAAALAGEE
ncbi:MAG: hypothetical protein B6247_24840 [Candidatus Parabeggiatoa sp. nov. 2]|nr:MAG: hypothetical protein B6247_24840 [Beggiatoa sp. 4572_84]